MAAHIVAEGGEAIAVTTDVMDPEQLERLAIEATDRLGPITCWVNNAGGSPMRMPMTSLPREECFNPSSNLTAVYDGCMVAARQMDRAPSSFPQAQGQVQCLAAVITVQPKRARIR